jgi:hypothetical protein
MSSEFAALETKVGRKFKKARYGIKQVVTLEKIHRDKAQLREVGHEDAFTLPIPKFLKFFEELKQ